MDIAPCIFSSNDTYIYDRPYQLLFSSSEYYNTETELNFLNLPALLQMWIQKTGTLEHAETNTHTPILYKHFIATCSRN